MRGKSARTVRGPAGAEFRSRPHGRVPQGSPKGRRAWGRLFFGYFLLAKQKKVTCRRAIPGELDFEFAVQGKTTRSTGPPTPRTLCPIITCIELVEGT